MPVDELRVLNALIGFCVPRGGTWPTPLAALAYEVLGIEKPMTTTSSTGKDRKVVADLALASPLLNHVLCVEAKGKWPDQDQAQAYESLTPDILVEQLGLSRGLDRTSLLHDALYATSAEHIDTFVEALNRAGISLPVVSANETLFQIARGRLQQNELDSVFRAGIVVSDRNWPSTYVPFTPRSPKGKMVAPVTSAIVRFVVEGSEFTVDAIAEKTLPYWTIYGTEERAALRTKIKELVRAAAAEELRAYLHEVSGRRGLTLQGNGARHPSQILALNTAASTFVKRTESGDPFRPKQHRLTRLDGS